MILNRDLYKKHGFVKGFYLSLKQSIFSLSRNFFLRSPKKIEYPFERYEYSDRFRGEPYLTVKENGDLRCTACMLCVDICPSKCIHIEAEERGDSEEKLVAAFDIEILRCIFCGLCEEACPVDAIRLSGDYELSGHREFPWLLDHHHLAYRNSLENGKGVKSKVQ